MAIGALNGLNGRHLPARAVVVNCSRVAVEGLCKFCYNNQLAELTERYLIFELIGGVKCTIEYVAVN